MCQYGSVFCVCELLLWDRSDSIETMVRLSTAGKLCPILLGTERADTVRENVQSLRTFSANDHAGMVRATRVVPYPSNDDKSTSLKLIGETIDKFVATHRWTEVRHHSRQVHIALNAEVRANDCKHERAGRACARGRAGLTRLELHHAACCCKMPPVSVNMRVEEDWFAAQKLAGQVPGGILQWETLVD